MNGQIARFSMCLVACAGLACGAEPSPGDGTQPARATPELRTRRYLATGDSVPFGFNPLVDPSDPSNFVGYPEQVRDDVGFRFELNTACPGETSGSFLSPRARDNGCRAFKAQFPLHDGFHPSETQIVRDFFFLLFHPNTDLVTVQIGANDLFLLLRDCLGDTTCILQRLADTINTIGQNLAHIYQTFHRAGFRGQLVGVLYYSTDYRDPLTTAGVMALNQVVTTITGEFGGQVADAFSLFQQASAPFGGDPCAAGLLIALPTGGCDIHPSAAGRNLLATAVEAVLQ